MTRATPTHSPAPFALDRFGEVRDANGATVATVHTDIDDRLFHRAPELLAACRTFVRRCERGASSGRSTYLAMKSLVDEIDGAS